jgi:hypothetical protein
VALTGMSGFDITTPVLPQANSNTPARRYHGHIIEWLLSKRSRIKSTG